MKNRIPLLKSSLLAALFVLESFSLSAICRTSGSELSFSGGWRQDHLRSSTTTNVDTTTDLIRGSQLNIWQIGLQGRLTPALGGCECFETCFIKGSAYWGWIDDGNYLHRIVPAPDTTVTFDRGDINHGLTKDFNVGGGFLLDSGCGLKIGPTGGYAWNKLSFNAQNVIGVIDTLDVSTVIDPFAYFDENVMISSRWQGPWAGFEAQWNWNGWNLNASYEYHWARWKGHYRSPSLDLDDGIHFSDSRTASNGWGNTAYVGMHYTFCDSLIAGIGVKYQYYFARGRLTPTAVGGFPAVGGVEGQVDTVKTTWISTAVVLDVGYAF